MSRERKALPEDDDLRLSAGATESESALDTFELERALLATDLQGRPPEEDPMDFFADEDPSVLLDRSDELSEVTWYNPVVLPSADHTRESYSNASSEARDHAVNRLRKRGERLADRMRRDLRHEKRESSSNFVLHAKARFTSRERERLPARRVRSRGDRCSLTRLLDRRRRAENCSASLSQGSRRISFWRGGSRIA